MGKAHCYANAVTWKIKLNIGYENSNLFITRSLHVVTVKHVLFTYRNKYADMYGYGSQYSYVIIVMYSSGIWKCEHFILNTTNARI
jgi:hypothetical protein